MPPKVSLFICLVLRPVLKAAFALPGAHTQVWDLAPDWGEAFDSSCYMSNVCTDTASGSYLLCAGLRIPAVSCHKAEEQGNAQTSCSEEESIHQEGIGSIRYCALFTISCCDYSSSILLKVAAVPTVSPALYHEGFCFRTY
jgi:hypothetical protein